MGESLYLEGKSRAARRVLDETIALREKNERRGTRYGGSAILNHAEYAYFLAVVEGDSGDLARGIDACDLAMKVAREAREENGGVGKDNPFALNLEAWIREARDRYEFAARAIDREEVIARQREIVAIHRDLRDRNIKAYALSGVKVNEWSAAVATLAGYLIEAGRAEEALTILREPIADQESLVANDNPDNREVPEYDLRNFVFRRVLADLMARKAQALAMQGRADEAVLAVGRAVAIVEPLTESEPCYLDDLARHLALASTLPDSAGIAGAADRAVESIRRWIAEGFDNPYKLEHDERLSPLRDREDFRAMVRELRERIEAEEGR
ncbi:MAG: hypothetical protein U0800_25500 [Isosphaeraceae bacterium]